MKASSKRILSILFSALFLLGTLIVYGNLIQPEIDTASGLQSTVASKTNLLNSQKNAVAQVSTLISQFQNTAALQKTVTLAMPIGSDTTDILNQWQAIAQASGVTLQALNVQPVAPSGAPAATSTLVRKLGNISISFSAIGPYPALKQFLEELETNVRVTNVETFNLTSASTGGQGGTTQIYTLQANVSSFYQID